MKKFITETVQVLLRARMPGTRPDRGRSGVAAAFRYYALPAFLVLGLLGGIGQAQEPLKIDSNGDVSIAKKLSVNGGANVPGNVDIGTLNFGKSEGDKISLWGRTGEANYGFSIANSVLQIKTNAESSSIVFGYRSGTTFTETMRITGTGEVGIGTTTPNANTKLKVAGTGYFSNDLQVGSNPIKFTSKWSAFPDSPNPTNGAEISNDTDSYKSLMIVGNRSSGERTVGIWDRLKVHGTLVVDGVIWTHEDNVWRYVGRSGLYDQGGKWGNVPDFESDVRLKRDLLPIGSPLESVRRLNGVTYRWNDEALKYFTKDVETTIMAGPDATAEENQEVWQAERHKRYKELSNTQVGVIAQDVEAVLPQAVTTDASGYKSVKYYELIPLVIEALKEEDKISQEQAQTMARQQAEIQRLTVANQAAQLQLNELQEVKHKLALLEDAVNKSMDQSSFGDKRRLASKGERPAGDLSEPE